MTTCFNCGRELKGNSRHIVVCASKKGIDKLEAKRLQTNHKIGFEVSKDYLEEFYIVKEMSLPDMKDILEISFSEITQLLDFYDIPRRNQKCAGKKRAQKAKATLQNKFGVDNVSQLDNVKEKKKKTFKENYGVDNIFQAHFFKENRDIVMMEKYGKTNVTHHDNRHKNLSDEYKKEIYKRWNDGFIEWFNKKSDEEKSKWINHTKGGGNVSKLETRIQSILNSFSVEYITQFHLGRYFYDFRLSDSKIILEINGDFWHANPLIYKSDDLLPTPMKPTLAQTIWDKDLKKNGFAETKGYTIIKIWEQEMKSLNDKDLEKLLLERIGNVKHSND